MLGMPPPRWATEDRSETTDQEQRSHFTDGEAEALTRREGPRQHRKPQASWPVLPRDLATGPSSLPVALPSLAPVCLQWEAFVSAQPLPGPQRTLRTRSCLVWLLG